MNNHPTIDILSSPDSTVPNPVFGCINYCFLCNDYILQAGAKAGFLLSFPSDNYPDGIDVSVGGKLFTSGTPGTEKTWSWQGTSADINSNFLEMLKANYYYGSNYNIEMTFGNIFVLAIENGEVPNWSMLFPVANPPNTFFNNPGADLITRPNYKLVVEVWLCEVNYISGTQVRRGSPIGTFAYSPDPNTSELCINIATILEGVVNTEFPGLNSGANILRDDSILNTICLRYGEVYSDDSGGCDASTKYFEETNFIEVINSVFQDDNEEGIEPFCYNGTTNPAPRFLTNKPYNSDVCTESFSWLYYYYDRVLYEVVSSNGFSLDASVYFVYSDGSASVGDLGSFPAGNHGVFRVPSGLAQIGHLAVSGKVVSYYEITVGIPFGTPSSLSPTSETMRYNVANDGFCCCHEEFYFLGEPGGFDTILFNCLRESDFEHSTVEFIGYEECGGDILEGGIQEAESKSFDVYRTTSRFLDNYLDLNWFREFLKSPIRYWRKDGKVYKIVLLSKEVGLRRKDGFIYVELEYILTTQLNTQRI